MTRQRRLLVSVVFALMLAMFVTTSAFAHFCVNANKKDGAGSIGTYDFATDTFTPNFNGKSGNSNGGFVSVVWVDGTVYDIFVHNLLPNGAQAAGPDGVSMCDGQGIDYFWTCIGVEPPF
jgi:hypothetical protein